jgi:hypothetical protein
MTFVSLLPILGGMHVERKDVVVAPGSCLSEPPEGPRGAGRLGSCAGITNVHDR